MFALLSVERGDEVPYRVPDAGADRADDHDLEAGAQQR